MSGLGAFIQGAFKGYEYGEGIKDRKTQRKRNEKRWEWEQENQEWRREDRDYAGAQRKRQRRAWERADDERDFLADLYKDTREEFDAQGNPVAPPDGTDRVSTQERPRERGVTAPGTGGPEIVRPQARPERGIVAPQPSLSSEGPQQPAQPGTPGAAPQAPAPGRGVTPNQAQPGQLMQPGRSIQGAAGVAPAGQGAPMPQSFAAHPRVQQVTERDGIPAEDLWARMQPEGQRMFPPDNQRPTPVPPQVRPQTDPAGRPQMGVQQPQAPQGPNDAPQAEQPPQQQPAGGIVQRAAPDGRGVAQPPTASGPVARAGQAAPQAPREAPAGFAGGAAPAQPQDARSRRESESAEFRDKTFRSVGDAVKGASSGLIDGAPSDVAGFGQIAAGAALDVAGAAASLLGFDKASAALERHSDRLYNQATSNIRKGVSATTGMDPAMFDMEPDEFRAVIEVAEQDTQAQDAQAQDNSGRPAAPTPDQTPPRPGARGADPSVENLNVSDPAAQDAAQDAAAAAQQPGGGPTAEAAKSAVQETAQKSRGVTGPGTGRVNPLDEQRVAENFEQYYIENAIPKIVQRYLSQGRIDKAREFQEFAEDSKVRAQRADLAKALWAGKIGDDDRLWHHLSNVYEAIDDGFSIDSGKSKIIRDEAGNITGAEIAVVNRETGETSVQKYENMSNFLSLVAYTGSTEGLFEHFTRQAERAREMRIKAAQGGQLDRLDVAKEIRQEADGIRKAQEFAADDARLTPAQIEEQARQNVYRRLGPTSTGASAGQDAGGPQQEPPRLR